MKRCRRTSSASQKSKTLLEKPYSYTCPNCTLFMACKNQWKLEDVKTRHCKVCQGPSICCESGGGFDDGDYFTSGEGFSDHDGESESGTVSYSDSEKTWSTSSQSIDEDEEEEDQGEEEEVEEDEEEPGIIFLGDRHVNIEPSALEVKPAVWLPLDDRIRQEPRQAKYYFLESRIEREAFMENVRRKFEASLDVSIVLSGVVGEFVFANGIYLLKRERVSREVLLINQEFFPDEYFSVTPTGELVGLFFIPDGVSRGVSKWQLISQVAGAQTIICEGRCDENSAGIDDISAWSMPGVHAEYVRDGFSIPPKVKYLFSLIMFLSRNGHRSHCRDNKGSLQVKCVERGILFSRLLR